MSDTLYMETHLTLIVIVYVLQPNGGSYITQENISLYNSYSIYLK